MQTSTTQNLGSKVFQQMADAIDLMKVNQSNYQPVILGALLTAENNEAAKKDLARILNEANPKLGKTDSFFMAVPVFEVLSKKGIIVHSADKNTFRLAARISNPRERVALVAMCETKISEARRN